MASKFSSLGRLALIASMSLSMQISVPLEDNLFVSFSKTDLGETTPSISNEDFWSYYKLDRTDKDMIEVIEQLGRKANGKLSDLVIVEVPDDVEWEIDDYDGMETVHEVHRSWC